MQYYGVRAVSSEGAADIQRKPSRTDPKRLKTTVLIDPYLPHDWQKGRYFANNPDSKGGPPPFLDAITECTYRAGGAEIPPPAQPPWY